MESIVTAISSILPDQGVAIPSLSLSLYLSLLLLWPIQSVLFLVLDFAKLCKQLFTLIISRKTDNRTKTFTINSSFIVAS